MSKKKEGKEGVTQKETAMAPATAERKEKKSKKRKAEGGEAEPAAAVAVPAAAQPAAPAGGEGKKKKKKGAAAKAAQHREYLIASGNPPESEHELKLEAVAARKEAKKLSKAEKRQAAEALGDERPVTPLSERMARKKAKKEERRAAKAAAEAAEAAAKAGDQPAAKRRKVKKQPQEAAPVQKQEEEPVAEQPQQEQEEEVPQQDGPTSNGGDPSSGAWEEAVQGGGGTAAKAFQRVNADEWLNKKGSKDNSYVGTFGQNGYGFKAQQVLGQVRGKDFRHEKTKKKRGSYKGGPIDPSATFSFKFESDDE